MISESVSACRYYTTVDLGMSYTVSETVTLSAAIYNAFDETTEEAEFGMTREGRSLWLSTTARF